MMSTLPSVDPPSTTMCSVRGYACETTLSSVSSMNQARFIEDTLLSVVSQAYPRTEHIVVDGGSTDGSVDIIRRYAPYLRSWVSEHDRGQSHAINKGLAQAQGDVLT